MTEATKSNLRWSLGRDNRHAAPSARHPRSSAAQRKRGDDCHRVEIVKERAAASNLMLLRVSIDRKYEYAVVFTLRESILSLWRTARLSGFNLVTSMLLESRKQLLWHVVRDTEPFVKSS